VHAAALLLLTACTAGEPDDGLSPLPDGDCSVEATVNPTLCDRVKCCLKLQDSGYHIHCEYPGVIPNTEHYRFCQRVKDCLFPNKAWWPKKKDETPAEEPAPVEPKGFTPMPGAEAAGPLYRTIYRMRWGGTAEIYHTPPGVTVDSSAIVSAPMAEGETITQSAPVQTAEKLGMPRRFPAVMPAQIVPVFQHKTGTETLHAMPTRLPDPAAPAKFTPPQTPELGPRLND
jgi:hypothetical protein